MNADLIEYYANLLIIQYKTKENASAHIKKLISALMIYDVMVLVRDGFNIETAVGPQLDILARIVGVDRVVTGTAFDRSYFGYADYSEYYDFTYFSYVDYSAGKVDIQFRRYDEELKSIYSLNDEELRMMIEMKIVKNNSNASCKMIDDILYQYFGTDLIFIDRLNMSIAYIFNDSDRRIVTLAVAEDLLPRPNSVAMSVSFTKDTSRIFGYQFYGGSKPDYTVGYMFYEGEINGGWAFYGET